MPDYKEEFAKYLYDTTRLIICRGYRIFTSIQDKFSKNDEKIIDKFCNEIGLENK